MMDNSERRRSTRIFFASKALLRYGDEDVMEATVNTRDISLHGVFLQTEGRIPLGTSCAIEISLAGNTSVMEFFAQGIVQRHDADGMGIAFTHLEPDNYLHIFNLVKLHSDAE